MAKHERQEVLREDERDVWCEDHLVVDWKSSMLFQGQLMCKECLITQSAREHPLLD